MATIEADWSLAETVSALARSQANHVRLRHGLIAIDRDTPWKTRALQNSYFYGLTYGVFPGLAKGHDQFVWSHEMVHVIQDLQFDSVEPPVCTFGGTSESSSSRPLFAFRHIRFGVTYLLNAPDFLRRYQRRWGEVEAYGLAQHTPVQH